MMEEIVWAFKTFYIILIIFFFFLSKTSLK